MRIDRAAPRACGMRRGHLVAAGAGHLRSAAGETRPVADPAGSESRAAGGPFRGVAVTLGRGGCGDPPGDLAVVAPGGVPEAGDVGGSAGEIPAVAIGARNGSAVGDVGLRGGCRMLAAGGYRHPPRRTDPGGGGTVAPASRNARERDQQEQRYRGMPKVPEWRNGERHGLYRPSGIAVCAHWCPGFVTVPPSLPPPPPPTANAIPMAAATPRAIQAIVP